MKILPYLLVVTLLFCGCKGMSTMPTAMQLSKSRAQSKNSCSAEARKSLLHIETGDLLFVGLPMNYHSGDNAPSVCDGDTNFIHTAILDVDSRGKIWIIDATFKRGVARYPLDTFLVDFTLSGVEKLKRLRKITLTSKRLKLCVIQNTKDSLDQMLLLFARKLT